MRLDTSLCPGAAAPSAPHRRCGLDDLRPNTPARITGLAEALSDTDRELVLRLLEVGFLPGEPVQVLARGFPRGNPLAVRVGRSTFALRREEAAWVRVEAVA